VKEAVVHLDACKNIVNDMFDVQTFNKVPSRHRLPFPLPPATIPPHRHHPVTATVMPHITAAFILSLPPSITITIMLSNCQHHPSILSPRPSYRPQITTVTDTLS
jgi:hypothetical protein